MSHGSRRAIVAALLANSGIAVAKFAAFMATGAASMLAEAVHSVADSANQGLLLWGTRQAERPATSKHPFGYGRERFFWAFVVAIVLFLLGGVFAINAGIDKLRHPHEVESLGWAVGVLLTGIVLESLSFRTAIREALPLRGDASWWSFVRSSKNPELPVVLLEDAGALLGLILALVGVSLAAVSGNPVWDSVGSIAIGCLLCVIAVVLAIEMKSLLIGESASTANITSIRDALAATPGVVRLLHLRTLHIGPEQLFVGAKLELDAGLDFAGVARVINDAETRVREAVESVDLIYLEPDAHDPARPPDA